MSNIKVQALGSPYRGARSFQITGEPESPNWRADWESRGKPEPTCEITVLVDSLNEPYLISFGGPLWPLAWPSLFIKRSTYTTGLTAEGKRLLAY